MQPVVCHLLSFVMHQKGNKVGNSRDNNYFSFWGSA